MGSLCLLIPLLTSIFLKLKSQRDARMPGSVDNCDAKQTKETFE
jgi:hypothetical protein